MDIDIDYVLFACCNLLVVDPCTKTCEFSHLSVREYVETGGWSTTEVHHLAGKTCLLVLTAKEPLRPSSVTPPRDVDRAVGPSVSENKWVKFIPSNACNAQALAIYSYAVEYWNEHCNRYNNYWDSERRDNDDRSYRLGDLMKKYLGPIEGVSYRQY